MTDNADTYIIVTGATGGIGRAICRRLVSTGVSVVATCRDRERGEVLADELRRSATGGAEVRCELLCLDAPASICDFARRIGGLRISSLINNAGVMCRHYSLTAHGLEQTMAVNYFGTVSVTRRLHRLADSILCPTEKDFSQLGTYGRSKLALTHYAMHLAGLWQGRLRVNCADPGVVNSGMITMHRWFDPLANLLFRPFTSSPGRGAESAMQACLSPHTGMIFHHANCHPIANELRPEAAHTRLVAQTDEWLRQYQVIHK